MCTTEFAKALITEKWTMKPINFYFSDLDIVVSSIQPSYICVKYLRLVRYHLHLLMSTPHLKPGRKFKRGVKKSHEDNIPWIPWQQPLTPDNILQVDQMKDRKRVRKY